MFRAIMRCFLILLITLFSRLPSSLTRISIRDQCSLTKTASNQEVISWARDTDKILKTGDKSLRNLSNARHLYPSRNLVASFSRAVNINLAAVFSHFHNSLKLTIRKFILCLL